MPVSPGYASGISPCQFWNSQSSDEFWSFIYGLADSQGEESKNTKFPSTLQLWTLSWNSASWPPFFLPPSQWFVPHVCPCIWHFENSSELLWSLEPDIFSKRRISQALFLLLYKLYMDLIKETQDLTDHQLTVCFQTLPWEGISTSQGGPDSSNTNYFPLCPL